MSKKRPANIGASVRQRLLNQARTDKRTFSELLQYFAMDRFLYRMSISDYVDSFILKGVLMLRAWQSPVFRPTMDINMLAHRTSNEIPEYQLYCRFLLVFGLFYMIAVSKRSQNL